MLLYLPHFFGIIECYDVLFSFDARIKDRWRRHYEGKKKKDHIFILVRHLWNDNGRNVRARHTYKSNFENRRYTIINIYKFGKLTLQKC